jgi:hypothetical protein
MFGPANYLIAILGCGEAEAPCQQVQVQPVRYETEAQCLAATDDAAAQADVAFPVVVAECRRAGATPVSLRADAVRRPGPADLGARIQTASARR